MCNHARLHVDRRYRLRHRFCRPGVQRSDGAMRGRDPVSSDRAELRILRALGVLIVDGPRLITIWRYALFILACKLFTKRADLTLKRVNLTVPAKDHA